MALETRLTLAEALVERKGLNQQLESLRQRLAVNARVQDGDRVAEAPDDLLEQVSATLAGLERLTVAINRTNLATSLPGEEGWSLMEAIARRDMMALRQGILEATVSAAQTTRERWAITRNEVRSAAVVDVAALQREIDELARERRMLDVRLQAANWSSRLAV